MAEAVRKSYWRPDDKTLREMAQRWRDLKAKGAQSGEGETAAVLMILIVRNPRRS
ncbi:hypothetical protein [Caulobacter hibisci]|uniref:hypothetical protein n=1 Tax=Caulobacter hibisci TaxID=2035993 RepID=UPI0018E36991|nr:hypothetical protein [Caulobacter hibisci]